MADGQKPERSELALRVMSAIVLIVICLPLIWLGGTPFFLMCAVLSGLLLYEFFGIFRSNIAEYQTNKSRWLAGAVIYGVTPIVCLPLIRGAVAPPGLYLLLFLFLSVWITDIAAYFAGRSIGGPKLWPAVSPKKTWSGGLGGLLSAMVFGGVFASAVEGVSVVPSTMGAGLLSVFSQAGDFLESWIKRRFGVKDSSNLIPGHGGFMDRVDGLVVAALPMALYVLITVN